MHSRSSLVRRELTERLGAPHGRIESENAMRMDGVMQPMELVLLVLDLEGRFAADIAVPEFPWHRLSRVETVGQFIQLVEEWLDTCDDSSEDPIDARPSRHGETLRQSERKIAASRQRNSLRVGWRHAMWLEASRSQEAPGATHETRHHRASPSRETLPIPSESDAQATSTAQCHGAGALGSVRVHKRRRRCGRGSRVRAADSSRTSARSRVGS